MSDAGLRSPLEVLGPGLVTGAADDDPSGVGTYSQVGAQFGYGMGWTLVFGFPLLAAIQAICARIGATTGRGIAQNLRKHYSIVKKPNNALQLSLTYIEGLIFSVALFLFPVIDLRFFLFFMPPYLVFILILGGYAAVVRKRWDLFYYAPTYIVLIFINAFIFLEQFWVEIVLRRTNLVWFHPERREIA